MIIGITGSFGSGKTTVAKVFKSLGAEVIDADRIAHRIIKPGSKIYKKIVNTFSKDILKNNNGIDRYKLAHIVFNNKNLLGRLNKIMHPEIIRIMENQLRSAKSRLIVLDAPLLVEAGLKEWVDKLVVVKINKRVQLERLLDKTSLSKTAILKRIKCQLPLEEKVRIADFVIDNSGAIGETKKQVKQVFKVILSSLSP